MSIKLTGRTTSLIIKRAKDLRNSSGKSASHLEADYFSLLNQKLEKKDATSTAGQLVTRRFKTSQGF